MAGNRHAERRRRVHASRLRGDEGAALVEFALILPFLAVVAFGTIDLGRSYELKNAVTNMAREGAFVAMSNPCPPTAAITAARNENPDLADEVDVKIVEGTSTSGSTITCDPNSQYTDLTVVVTTKMQVITPLVGAIVGNEVTITGSATVKAPHREDP